ncbi:hypothetical protein J3459_018166 [Metarhizium acridum]|uniref:uncharacterized protein n=1 Tax=Metarhizium acridum TaxID=92637 RepID=UPI001C6A98E0|nr:hypothetical protein J3459_018166 [Metarhizium acridum]KAG8410903.1 hypothetical protein J3458_016468 [Metarhizium acridum]
MSPETTIEDQIWAEDLDDNERTVVEGLHDWLARNERARWKQSKHGIELCQEQELYDLASPILPKDAKNAIFRTNSTWQLKESGKLIPIYASEGCSITYKSKKYSLEYGKKLHLPTQVTLEVAEQSMPYLLWIVQ